MNFSVVTTIFNDREELDDLLMNVCSQTIPPSEIVITDGGSNKQTIEFINNTIRKYSVPIKYIVGRKLNISEGFNEGIRQSNYDYIMLVGVGNHYPIDCFEMLVSIIEKEKLDYAYPPYNGQNNTPFSELYNQVMLGNNRGSYLPYASNHGVLMKKKVFEEMGFFYENFVYAGEDEEFYKKVLNNGYIGKLVENAIVGWDTPRTWEAYKKQVKAYTIAKMQIYTIKEIFRKDIKAITYVTGLFIATMMIIIPYLRVIGISIIGIYVLINVIKCLQKGLRFVALKNASYFLPILCYLSQCKYFLRKYHVDDLHREKVKL